MYSCATMGRSIITKHIGSFLNHILPNAGKVHAERGSELQALHLLILNDHWFSSGPDIFSQTQ